MASDVALSSAKALEVAPAGDDALLALCRAGDPDAFAQLVAQHESMVFGLAARMLGDVEEARDVAQEVFLQVYRAVGRFEGRSRLKTWIYRIVLNQCRNRRRFWRRRARRGSCSLDALTAADEARLAAARDDADGPFAGVARRERIAKVNAALGRLRFEQRAILLLREKDGLSCEEIAAALGLAQGTVKSRLPAAFVFAALLAGAVLLDATPRLLGRGATLPSGTEGRPLALVGVDAPRIQAPALADDLVPSREDSHFFQTVVARDGRVAEVTLLDGLPADAGRLMNALLRERFEPAQYRGRPVAVSVYRLISRLDVLAPET
ncbi:MAG TPA: sigma-70 family RNA polymerase sigma factor [Vicinamibacteria bacterium]|nr:sigma-70 family RNA polymerase sigma factor [Vicinamibacteria bacterium]